MSDQISVLQEKLSTWFQSLTDSEQKLLKLASVFFVIFILYFVISSIHNGVSESERKLQQQQDLNAWALQQIAVIKSSSGKKTQSSGSITQVINTTARKYNINIARLQPQKNDLVKVGLDDVGFNRLMQWLLELQSQHSVVVENIDFASADEEGKVKVRRLDLGRG